MKAESIPLVDAAVFEGGALPLLLAVRRDEPAGRETAAHSHAAGQLIGALTGLLSVETPAGRWVAPAVHAVWIPPGIPHGLRSFGPYSGWSVYVGAAACSGLPAAPCALQVDALLRALVLRLAQWPQGPQDARQQRMAQVFLDELAALPAQALSLPLPQEPRLLAAAQAQLRDLGSKRSVEDWAREAAMSVRSFSRRFAEETGASFGAWRTQARLLAALEKLSDGEPVKAVAWELGYEDTSSFIAAFRRAFGQTPAHYVARAQEAGVAANA